MPKLSLDEVIEISDDSNEADGCCKAFANGNCRRQATQKKVQRETDRVPNSPRVDPARRLRLSNPTPNDARTTDSNGVGSTIESPSIGNRAINGVVAEKKNTSANQDENDLSHGALRRSLNGVASPTTVAEVASPHSARFPSGSAVQANGRLTKLNSLTSKKLDLLETLPPNKPYEPETFIKTEDAEEAEDVRANAESTPSVSNAPVVESVHSQKQFLKPPSAKTPLSKKEFANLTLEEVDDIVTK